MLRDGVQQSVTNRQSLPLREALPIGIYDQRAGLLQLAGH